MASLNGLGILVTRPLAQSENLARLIRDSGGQAIVFPVMDIEFPPADAALSRVLDQLQDYQMVIFISANAVHGAMGLIKDRGGLPQDLRIATVGKASAKVLKSYHYQSHIVPQTFNSEGLLAHEELQNLAGKRILIFRGEGGREVLAQGLRQRGAQVDYAEVYRRVLPNKDTRDLLTQWARGEIQLVTTTSNEGLQNLFDMLGKLGGHWLQATPLLVVSGRAVELAKQLGCKTVIQAENATDEAILAAIKKWYHERT